MSHYSALSIWENNPHSMNWYDHMVGRKTPTDPFITPNTEVSFELAQDTENFTAGGGDHNLAYQDAWFSELKAHDREKEASRCKREQAKQDTSAVPLKNACIGVAQQADSGSEYMFANFSSKNGSGSSEPNSIDDLSFSKISDDDGKKAFKAKSAKNKGFQHIKPLKNTVRKRNAAESFGYEAGPGFNHRCIKKARLISQENDASDATIKRVMSIDGSSILSDTTTARTASSFFNHRPLAVAPKGYAGQFNGMVIRSDSVADYKHNLTGTEPKKSGIRWNFGDPRHPNGVFTHASIVADKFTGSPDFSKEILPTGHPLLTCMNFATDMTIAATHDNIAKLRSHDEEILRRESHIECAHARLEGVSVGYYRYYQGHLSVEEYHDAEMCIC